MEWGLQGSVKYSKVHSTAPKGSCWRVAAKGMTREMFAQERSGKKANPKSTGMSREKFPLLKGKVVKITGGI